jgi:hypothetical protein
MIWARCGPIEERLIFEAGLISEERYLKGTDIQLPGELKRRDITRIHQASNEGRPACIRERRGNNFIYGLEKARYDCGQSHKRLRHGRKFNHRES